MPEDELEKRIRTLEIRAATMLGSIVTLAACCLAFLGFEYYRIPGQVQQQLEEKIGRDTVELLSELINKAKRMEGQNAQIYPDVSHGKVVHPPKGTEIGDWVAFISPSSLGREEHTTNPKWELDNSILAIESKLINTDDGWKVEAKYKFKYGSNVESIKWEDGKANVLLIPSLKLKSSNQANSADVKRRAAD